VGGRGGKEDETNVGERTVMHESTLVGISSIRARRPTITAFPFEK
jgi:hypothetical protein